MSEEMCTCNNVPASECSCEPGCMCGCKPEEESETEEAGTEDMGDDASMGDEE